MSERRFAVVSPFLGATIRGREQSSLMQVMRHLANFSRKQTTLESLSARAFELRDEREHNTGSVVGTDPASEFGGAVAIGRSVEAGPQRVGQGVGGQFVQWQWVWRNAEAVQPVRPEGLVDQDGHRDRWYSRAEPGPGGACSGVVDHGSRPGKQPVVWQVTDDQDVVTGGARFGPAGPHAGPPP